MLHAGSLASVGKKGFWGQIKSLIRKCRESAGEKIVAFPVAWE